MVGHFLEKEDQSYCFIDAPQQKSCTSVAAGVMNPITGRRYVKSWGIDELFPFAKTTYQAFEETYGESYFTERIIIRSLFNHGDENTWVARYADPEYKPYMVLEPDLGPLRLATQPAFTYAQIAQGAQVHIGRLCDRLRSKELQAGKLLEELFDIDQLEIYSDKVKYKNIIADHIIFCEGWRGRLNPYFSHLPFEVTKGEILHIKLPEVKIDRMFKHRVFIVPFGEDTYWIGATSENDFENEEPTQKNKEYLLQRIEQMLDTPFELVDHKAAIRPTVKDRRPFIGKHSEHKRLLIFNGMGSKGASLAPFWAKHFVDHLVHGESLDKAVNIERFLN